MDNIEISINELNKILNETSPKLKYNLFPSSFNFFENILDLCFNNKQRNDLIKWLNNNNINNINELILQTSFNYNSKRIIIDKIIKVDSNDLPLYSISNMIKLMIIGDINETNRLKERFFQLNGFTNTNEISHYFNETYQSLYALRVIISNIPGIVIEIGGKTLPIEESSEFISAIESVSYLHSIKLDSDNEDNDGDDNDNDNDNENNEDKLVTKVVKKRKHKRSKNR